jgi:YHS domain-containing protein
MDWLSQSWIYLVVAAVTLFLARHGGMGCVMGTQGGNDTEVDERIDPVSGKIVPPDVSIAAGHQGRTYYLVSRENRERFEAAPHKYAPVPHAHSQGRRHGHC